MVIRHPAPALSFTKIIFHYAMTKNVINVINTRICAQKFFIQHFRSSTAMNGFWGKIWGNIGYFHSVLPQTDCNSLKGKGDSECLAT
jgi:hypothetical protein